MAELVVITDDADRATLEAAITALRQQQRQCVIPSTAAEKGAQIDWLIEWWQILGD